MEIHKDLEVVRAWSALCDALCASIETTGRTSALVLREGPTLVLRAVSGKPVTNQEVSDERLFQNEAASTLEVVPVRDPYPQQQSDLPLLGFGTRPIQGDGFEVVCWDRTLPDSKHCDPPTICDTSDHAEKIAKYMNDAIGVSPEEANLIYLASWAIRQAEASKLEWEAEE